MAAIGKSLLAVLTCAPVREISTLNLVSASVRSNRAASYSPSPPRSPPVDAIVLDINMPGGSGEDTLKKLKMSTRTLGIPVIILSGSIDPKGQERVRSEGAAAVLSKPLVPEELFQALAAAL
ncbi:MAG TPA: response regulator [Gemmatimonadaceae bacterium]|nr:response regulator [Gemmatimonadaceae bacterium]